MATKKKAAPNTSVAVQQKGGQLAAPSFMQRYAGKGVEQIDTKDIEIPRLMLLSSMHTQVMEGDHNAGDFFHSIAEESLGDEIEIVPIYTDVSYILWKPRHMGGGILARSEDGIKWTPPDGEFEVQPNKDDKFKTTWKVGEALTQWGSSDPRDANSQPAATKMYNVVCFIPSRPDLSPCVVTLQRGAVRIARKLMGKLKILNAPSFGTKLLMSAAVDTNSDGEKFHNFTFQHVGFVEDEDEFELYKSLYEQFKRTGVNIKDIDSLQDEDSESEEDEGGDELKY